MGVQANILVGSVSAAGGGGNPPGVTDPLVDFTIGDGQSGTPLAGDTFWRLSTFQGQPIYNMQLLVIREGIPLNWNTPVTANGEIRRYNNGGLGGFTWQGGGSFFAGERYQVYIIGQNLTIQV